MTFFRYISSESGMLISGAPTGEERDGAYRVVTRTIVSYDFVVW